MGQSISKQYQGTKDWVKRHPLTSAVLFGAAVGGLITLLKPNQQETMLSRFLLLLKNEAIEECIVVEDKVYFRGLHSTVWHFTNVSMLSKDMLYKLLLQNENLNVSCETPQELNSIIALGTRK